MLGVASEQEFNRMLDVINDNDRVRDSFKRFLTAKNTLKRLENFRRVVESGTHDLPYSIRENLDSNLSGIGNIIRTFRNDSGHPSGRIIEREQVYVLMNLFVAYVRQIHDLCDHFAVEDPADEN